MSPFRSLLFCLFAATALPAGAQTLAPPAGSVVQPSAAKNAPSPKVAAAPRVPVVQAPKNAHAQKAPAKPVKPAARPTLDPKATAGAGAVAGATAGAATTATLAAPAPEPPPPPDPNKGSVTGLPIPRYMSLRFDDVNLRVGPGTRYPIDWVYHRRDLPVEILRELEEWRLVQDQDNIRGWVRAPTLSPRRGVAIRGAERTLRAKPADDAVPVAVLKPGVVGRLRSCATGSNWCEIEVSTYRGYLKREEIYGVYPNETIGG